MTDNAPLTRTDLIEAMSKGIKPKDQWRIGAEHEKFGFDKTTLARPAYDGPNGIKAMLEGLQRFGWLPVEENGFLIGLERRNSEGFVASVSLEPGGQFELSGAPLLTIHDICNETGQHLMEVKQVADQIGVGFLGAGFDPLWTREQVPVMPKGRYDIMRAYMPKVGALGLDMMLRTCTIQANLDFDSEADMVMKFRTSLALQPIATALFACSPFTEGRPNGFLSARANVWTDTDADRTGMLGFVFEDGFGFERYADYALDTPMYFAKRDGRYVDASGQSFRDFQAGKLPALPGQYPTLKDWNDHLTTLFPEVRLKAYLEMRGADGGPWSRICALPALGRGSVRRPIAGGGLGPGQGLGHRRPRAPAPRRDAPGSEGRGGGPIGARHRRRSGEHRQTGAEEPRQILGRDGGRARLSVRTGRHRRQRDHAG